MQTGRAATASIGRRLASVVYESLLLLGLLTVLWLLPHVLAGMLWQIASPAWLKWLHLFLVPGIYFSWLWSGGRQTLAMQTWKLALTDAQGAELSCARACLRYALAWPALLLCGAGLWWAWLDPDRQFLQDRLAGTRLIDARPSRSSPPPATGTGRSA